MSGKTGFERCWEGVDRTLLLLVFALLGFSVWESRKNGCPERERDVFRRNEPSQPVRRMRPSSGTVTAGTPVSLSHNRMSSIARTMSDQGWDDLPSSLAADMREQNGSYDIFFALPHRTDPSSVKVSTSGNVLTLLVNSAGAPPATFVKQFYIPCGAERAGTVETSVSNDIVRVRIRQRNG